MTTNAQNWPSLHEWEAMQLQLIAFPDDPKSALDNKWWEQLIGTDAESHRKKLERVDAGTVGGRILRVAVDPLRAAWAALPLVDLNEPSGRLPSLGRFTESRDSFCDLMRRWLAEFAPPLRRLALAGKLIQPAVDKADAYRRLGHYLPSVKLDMDSGEFQFRINRKRDSVLPVPGLAINRLVTWSAITLQTHVVLSMSGSNEGTEVTDSHMGCFMEFDINTIKEFEGVLPQEQLPEIWDELVGLTTEIAEKGDVK